MTVLQDILSENLKEAAPRVIVQQVFDFLSTKPDAGPRDPSRATTLTSAKSTDEFYDLVRRAVNDYETRSGVQEEAKVNFTEEDPDIDSQTESIVFSLINKVPGQFSQGAPMSRDNVNYRPRFRESYPDKENPGYRLMVEGYYYDSIVRFTCWGKTNKAANARAKWFEALMQEYSWWFKLQGVDRVLFWKRNADIVATPSKDDKWYGRPIDYFVRTEEVRVFREKTMEQIVINLSVGRT